ncbi:RagB/SusD family nutrient uptake outer membrane protein [Spirosoma sp. BT702]|uniref:RagB/SusD family nutrient uptake outer membrane protein n=1 Tax=Spirosoma profusum TaxID=2771354 RepID=A0A926XU50_9BACT|nr:RagB/SusD family nutrient uptake outer membrane protein [Spirosoma profusum]MBD2700207.1 RagB/SusD family nutrient uptake outer membrane protein [Spirosoma profusum]
MKLKYILILLTTVFFTSCDLEELPEATTSKGPIFSNESGLVLYTNSFYTMFNGKNLHRADAMSDYLARKDTPPFITEGNYSPQVSTDWTWTDLRNINYFIQNCNDPRVPVAVRKNYLGIARFFRAWFYFAKVKRFGDVPWIGKAIDVTETDLLFKPRDSRTVVMDSVIADLDYASQNITSASEPTRSLVTKYVAYAFKSRVCLHEGTFRKYHTNLGLQGSVENLLNQAAVAAKKVMDEGGYKLNDGAGTDKSYRQVFINGAPVATEVMLSAVCDLALNNLNDGNWYWTSGTYGDKASFIRTFINTYLNIDGTPYTNNPAYKTMLFKDEVKNRDKRLQQTIRVGDYKRTNNGVLVASPPLFSYTYTGYMPIKWTLDDMYYDTRDLNINSVSIFRYAEVLLNYAEAKAELNTLTDADWALTIGALRKRAGITGGLTAKPVVIDPYLQSKYFPGINSAVILEVRRERGIELCLEGFRFDDIVRWKRGELMQMEWNGMYVPELNTPMDLNEDGILDVAFYKNTLPANRPAGVTYVDVSPTVGGKPNSQLLAGDTSGELTWLNNIPRKFTDKNYYYPIPTGDIITNPKLTQNTGW